MIKDIFSLIGSLFKLILKGLFYIFKGIGWYMNGVEEAFKSYPRKVKAKIKLKEEVL